MDDQPVYTINLLCGRYRLRGPRLESGVWFHGGARFALDFARQELTHENGARVEVYAPDGSLFRVFEIPGDGQPYPPRLN